MPILRPTEVSQDSGCRAARRVAALLASIADVIALMPFTAAANPWLYISAVYIRIRSSVAEKVV